MAPTRGAHLALRGDRNVPAFAWMYTLVDMTRSAPVPYACAKMGCSVNHKQVHFVSPSQ